MNPRPEQEKRRWTVAIGGAAVVVAGLVFSLRWLDVSGGAAALPPAAPTEKARATIEMARLGPQDPALAEKFKLRDPTPLFLPTSRNVRLTPPTVREPGQALLDEIPQQLNFSEGFRERLPAAITLNGKPLDKSSLSDALAADDGSEIPLGFDRRPVTVTPEAPRGAIVEVISMAEGRVVERFVLPVEARPQKEQLWQPLELHAVLDAAGLVGPLTVTHGSSREEVDVHFKNYLVRGLRIGERLAPGFYRITVGP